MLSLIARSLKLRLLPQAASGRFQTSSRRRRKAGSGATQMVRYVSTKDSHTHRPRDLFSSVQLSRFMESDRIIKIQFSRILGIKVMAIELTLSIIKPDAVSKGHMGDILARFEKNGLRIVAAKLSLLSRWQVEQIYGIHKGRPFYQDLVQFMTSGPVMLGVLEGEDAVAKNREIMGNTDPHVATPGSIRADFGTASNRNAGHGSA